MNGLARYAVGVTGLFLPTLFSNIAPAEAVTLTDNRFGETVGFVGADFDNNDSGTSATEFGSGFDISQAAHITEILWSGTYGPSRTRTPFTDNFSVRLFTLNGVDDFGRVLTSPLATLIGDISYVIEPVQIYNSTDVVDVYFYTLSLSTPFSLGSGGYLLSIMNDTSADLDDNWGWTRTDQGGALFTYDPTEPWEMLSGGLYFAIQGETKDDPQAVPTPMLLLGLLGFGVTAWRQRKRRA
ncbi:hypothetical protein [Nodosilinea sp. FACHB-13]|uniref:hypothetical protein n=1 Tax=Cyanophyceae TaxID=3028117 RepID=UPI001687A9D9|nr:hypothetical protein [Nodosilinea sp. FACHB-13]MBD2105979.1 hypothetical protein [Nodosilinea sp. FACHB-13]